MTAYQGPPFVNLDEAEQHAKAMLPRMVFDYYSSGAESEQALRNNRAAFVRYGLLPRTLVDVSRVDTSAQLLGLNLAFPVLVAPMAMHGMAHPNKEIATARAAAAQGVPMCVSTMATTSLEDVAQVTASGPHPSNLLFQLYMIKDRALVASWVRGAEAAGYKALIVTVDAQRLGRREADERNRFHLPGSLQLANLLPLARIRANSGAAPTTVDRPSPGAASGAQQTSSDSGSGSGSGTASSSRPSNPRVDAATAQARPRGEGYESGLFSLFAKEVDDSLSWDVLPWLRSITRLPILVKGVLHPQDAALAVQHGAGGVIVSNHGGRQLDYAPAALDVLPAVVAAVAGRVPVLVDGGVRRGTDVVKALALGAAAVLVGRPVLWGLALGGQAGVERVLGMLQAEFELAMALCGCRSVGAISPHLLLQYTPLPVPLKCAAGSHGGDGPCSICHAWQHHAYQDAHQQQDGSLPGNEITGLSSSKRQQSKL